MSTAEVQEVEESAVKPDSDSEMVDEAAIIAAAASADEEELKKTFMKVLAEDDDDDLCEACRNREMQLLAAAVQAARTRRQAMDEDEALVAFMNEDCQQADRLLKEQREKSKLLQNEILHFNQHIVDHKREQELENKGKSPEGSNNYLLYKRPQTAEVNREKQRLFRDQLTAQVAAKQQELTASKQVNLDDSARFNESLMKGITKDEEDERSRAMRKKKNYRLALEAQMAAKVVGETSGADGNPWWAKRKEQPTEREHTDDQNRRVAQQMDAIRKLEEYTEKESAERGEKDRQRSEQRMLAQQQREAALAAEGGDAGPLLSHRERVMKDRAERQRLAEEAWAEAHANNRKKVEVLEHDRGGFIELLRKYRRCRKCQRPLDVKESQKKVEGTEKYWYDMTSDNMRPDDGGISEMPAKRHAGPLRVMSRHANH